MFACLLGCEDDRLIEYPQYVHCLYTVSIHTCSSHANAMPCVALNPVDARVPLLLLGGDGHAGDDGHVDSAGVGIVGGEYRVAACR